MTNRERAFEIAKNVKFTPHEDVHIFAGEIERALDEAEKRGQEKMRERAVQVAKEGAWIVPCFEDKKLEKAFNGLDRTIASQIEALIRALPVEE